MYIPKHFSEVDLAVVRGLIEQHPLATIITRVSSSNGISLNANHIPLHVVSSSEVASPAMPGFALRGHVARANPMLQDLRDSGEVLVVFVGVQAYISPSLYASKRVDGKVVPTWNYEAVHVHGTVKLIELGHGLEGLMTDLTHGQERHQAHPWAITDAPEDYTKKLMGAVVGIEITLEAIEAKRKLSQNQPAENKVSVVSGLTAKDSAASSAMAQAIAQINGL
jgi:transcriptional regulator